MNLEEGGGRGGKPGLCHESATIDLLEVCLCVIMVIVSAGQKFRSGRIRWFWLVISQKVAVKVLPKAAVI